MLHTIADLSLLIPDEKVRYVTHCEILDEAALNVSRHRPILCTFVMPSLLNVSTSDAEHTAINWKKVTQTNINNYQNIFQSNEHFRNISIDQLNSTQSIDQAYKTFVEGATVAAQKCFPVKSYKQFLKPYWSQELSGLHNKMLTYRSAWVSNGKPRGMAHSSYVRYKDAKRDFRRCHRKHANQYLQSQLDEIDRVAEVDSAHFWRLVNARRAKSNTNPGTELIFHGETFNTASDINREWGYYFRNLYTPIQNDHFDTGFYDFVTREVRHISSSLQNSTESVSFPEISTEEVESAVKLAKCNKAGGDDGLTYEHIEYGGQILFEFLSVFFTAMIRLSYSPKALKKRCYYNLI